jgi:hypothetical protein
VAKEWFQMNNDSRKMSTYTVIGVYAEDHQRFAESFRAETPEGAEGLAEIWAENQTGSPEIIIAGVVSGAATLVDEVA